MKLKQYVKNKINRTILSPTDALLDSNLLTITTTIGDFIIKKIQDKLFRIVTFTVSGYQNEWMENALYNILYKYNDIKNKSMLRLKSSRYDRNDSYFQLADGSHLLKYRDYDITLTINSSVPTHNMGMPRLSSKTFTIATLAGSDTFVTDFEKDMINQRNELLRINSDATIVNVYKDDYSDGCVYWDKLSPVHKRPLNTIYLDGETKGTIVDTVNQFFANKEYYRKHGIPHNLKILLYGMPGPQPVTTKIPTPDGIKQMGDLKIGDYVFDKYGNPTKVIGVYPQGRQEIFNVKFYDGRDAECTMDHLWNVYCTSHNRRIEKTLPLKQIMNETIRTTSGKIIRGRGYSVPNNSPVNFNARPLTIDPYVMGVMIANGCLRDEFLRISQDTEVIPKIVADIMGIKVKKRSMNDNDYSYNYYDSTGTRIRTSIFLKDYPELIDKYSYERYIPDDYLFNSVENRLSLLQGLMDTDGSINMDEQKLWGSPDIRYTTTSKKLALQVQWLARSFGFRARVNQDLRSDKYTSGYCASVRISCPPETMIKLFKAGRKLNIAMMANTKFKNAENNDLIKWKGDFTQSKITHIRSTDRYEDVVCIRVEHPEHLYLTEDFVVTHNTGKDSIARMVASEWYRNIYYVTGGKSGRGVPDSITSYPVQSPLFLVSDIDKYPFLINEHSPEPEFGRGRERVKTDNASDKAPDKTTGEENLSFGHMLNALDGLMSGEDRIIIMTTNHIERFSPTFFRPGRVDLMLEIKSVNVEVFRQFVYDFYDKIIPKDIKLKDDNLTIGELQTDVIFVKLPVEEFIKKYIK